MEDITHKILVDNNTGKIRPPIHPINSDHVKPDETTWIPLEPGTSLYGHFCCEPPIDISHIDLDEIFWDFKQRAWVEVLSIKKPSLESHKQARNFLLKISDKIIADLLDPDDIQSWIDYRQQLRTMFDGLSADTDWNTIVFPRSPNDLKALQEKAAQGDSDSMSVLESLSVPENISTINVAIDTTSITVDNTKGNLIAQGGQT